MRLLFVIDHFGSGGAQRQMVLLATGLVKKGHNVEFFIYYSQYAFYKSLLDQHGIVIHSLRKSRRFSVNVIPALYRTIRQGNYDCILSFLDTPNFYTELVHLGLRHPPLIASMRLSTPGRLPWQSRILMQFHRAANHIVVNSYHQRKVQVRDFPWLRSKISTIINGVDLDIFSPCFKNKINDTKKPIELLAVGRIDPQKNLSGIINALTIFWKRYGWVPVIRWAGKKDISESGQRYHAKVLEHIQQAGLRNSWEWLGERSDIPDLLCRHDALIHPALYEGLPNAVCEALASGLPVLASNVCDHANLVQHGETGFLFDPLNPEDMSGAIYEFASFSSTTRKEMGRKARVFAEQELSLKKYVHQYETLFRQVITQP